MKMAVRTRKRRPRMKRICRHGVYWKRLKMSSGRVNQASLLSVESSHSLSPKKAATV